ncbi:hypothetical protein AVEN_271198-1 [Araneus ventricosus]|uniref:Uncharacterized protein n=1 Tax=Araneus ventricosus TaxID=182803 RepID=A0A4Y2S797_ARAVE|nr:hypothetical protein AVEN_271198-1 [Araneus ventricosus]
MIWKTFIPTQRALRKRRKEKPPLRAIANQHVLERENKLVLSLFEKWNTSQRVFGARRKIDDLEGRKLASHFASVAVCQLKFGGKKKSPY